MNEGKAKSPFLMTEDWWAVYLGLGIVLVASDAGELGLVHHYPYPDDQAGLL